MTRTLMAMIGWGAAAAMVVGCHKELPTEGMQLKPPEGTELVDRPFPAWPPTEQAGYAALTAAEVQEQLPALADARWVAQLHNANESPFVVEASLCVDDPQAKAVTERMAASYALAGWATSGLGVGAEVVPVTRRFTRAGYVVTSYVANGTWEGCPDPAQQSYVTLVVGKLKLIKAQ